MSDFVAGFTARHQAATAVLQAAFGPPIGFAPAAIGAAPPPPPREPGPKHFSPADPCARPTEGWDPLDPTPPAPDSSFIDPLAAAHGAGFEEGYAAALAEHRAAADRDQGLMSSLASELAVGGRINRDQVAAQLRQTVMFLVTKLVGEVGIAADVLATRIGAAAELLADGAEAALLRVHPDDVALLDGRLPKSIFAAGDASVARGSFVLESASTVVEDGPGLWLDQLAAAIDRAPVPAC